MFYRNYYEEYEEHNYSIKLFNNSDLVNLKQQMSHIQIQEVIISNIFLILKFLEFSKKK